MSETDGVSMAEEGVVIAQPVPHDGPGAKVGVKLELVARDAPTSEFPEGKITGRYCNVDDLITQQWAQFVIIQVLAQASTLSIIDVTNTGRSVIGTPATITALTITAGTGATAASVTDYVVQTPVASTSGTIAGVVNWVTETTGTSGSFTVTGTITNTSGSTQNYSELALYVTNAAHNFAITHDVFTAVPVSNTGTLAITYTISNS